MLLRLIAEGVTSMPFMLPGDTIKIERLDTADKWLLDITQMKVGEGLAPGLHVLTGLENGTCSIIEGAFVLMLLYRIISIYSFRSRKPLGENKYSIPSGLC